MIVVVTVTNGGSIVNTVIIESHQAESPRRSRSASCAAPIVEPMWGSSHIGGRQLQPRPRSAVFQARAQVPVVVGAAREEHLWGKVAKLESFAPVTWVAPPVSLDRYDTFAHRNGPAIEHDRLFARVGQS